VLVGYPDTKASFWQQTGRAGRSGRACTNYLILREMPFDQYIAVNPDWLFTGSSESAVIDPDNLLIQLAHIRAAAAEIPLGRLDGELFPDLGEAVPILAEAGELTRQGDRYVWCGPAFPQGDYSLRNIDNGRYKLIQQESHEVITEMDELQAFRELHTGAVYMHGGVSYQVVRMEQESRTCYAAPFQGNYYTMPGGNTNIRQLLVRRECRYGLVSGQQEQASPDMRPETDIGVFFGDIHVEDTISMYKKLQFHNHQNLGYDQLPQPLTKQYDTESAWIQVPQEVVYRYRGMLQESVGGKQVLNNHFDGLCYALENAARMLTMTEKEDIGVITSDNAVGEQTDGQDQVVVYIYDKFVGGLGYAEKAYERMPEIVSRAQTLAAGCGCENGCIACIGDYRLSKSEVLWGLQHMTLSARMQDSGGESESVREKLRKRLEHLERN
ncbi:MAG: DUF1998 domain-containing protein, partial [Acetatifactor sp.]|nr:DUF1998 domain-containing protein [Acetatifactor sp.]